MKNHKKILIVLVILVLLSPLGLFLPEWFNAGDAWGEWSVETIKEETGIEPEGMKRDAGLYNSPVPDYNIGKEDDSLPKLSMSYILSGIIGVTIILIITFATTKLISGKKKDDTGIPASEGANRD
ncbi:MAG: PDGLE domain-containing protein [Bacteroidales bacterium]|nr:PDGLE domain-containing protein [Bacteroidales bacterium]